MNEQEIYEVLWSKLGEDFEEVSSKELQYLDKYYIDKNKDKFVVACKVFPSIKDLKENWETYQDEDIALYLQNNLFINDDIRWDTYYLILYSGIEAINVSELYMIERDRFCCKKIIINASNRFNLEHDLEQKLPMIRIQSFHNEAVSVANTEEFLNLVQSKVEYNVREILEIAKFKNQ